MVRYWFFAISFLVLALVGSISLFWPPMAWSLMVILPLVLLGLRDSLQSSHTVLRNFPVIGHGRYFMEMVRPEIQQYFIESNVDAYPLEREFRSVVYQRAKGELETLPFGTQRDVYRVGYEWAAHSIAALSPPSEAPRVTIGGPDCRQPYHAALFNISAMSYGAVSKNAVLALNHGAKKGNFAHDTGEGGISPYHLEGGGDLIWQIGTGYFGCRTLDGRFHEDRYAEQARRESVRMVEIKLSQGAKPGHGGVLPGVKVDAEVSQHPGRAGGRDGGVPTGPFGFFHAG